MAPPYEILPARQWLAFGCNSNTRLFIPYQQRIFEWTGTNVDDMLRDIGDSYTANDYYICGGMIVLQNELHSIEEWGLYDGQQRTITLTALCRGLYDATPPENKHTREMLKSGFAAAPASYDNEDEKRSETYPEVPLVRSNHPIDNDALWKLANGMPLDGLAEKSSISVATTQVSKFLKGHSPGWIEGFARYVCSPRVLVNITVCWNPAIAATLFEQHNNRGKPVEPSSILRNQLYHLVGKDNEEGLHDILEEIDMSIDEIRENCGSKDVSLMTLLSLRCSIETEGTWMSSKMSKPFVRKIFEQVAKARELPNRTEWVKQFLSKVHSTADCIKAIYTGTPEGSLSIRHYPWNVISGIVWLFAKDPTKIEVIIRETFRVLVLQKQVNFVKDSKKYEKLFKSDDYFGVLRDIEDMDKTGSREVESSTARTILAFIQSHQSDNKMTVEQLYDEGHIVSMEADKKLLANYVFIVPGQPRINARKADTKRAEFRKSEYELTRNAGESEKSYSKYLETKLRCLSKTGVPKQMQISGFYGPRVKY